jgi:glutaredoxin
MESSLVKTLEALPEGPKCRGCGRDAFAYTMGEWTCIECATQDQAQEICNQEQMPEIDFDANPNEQQCQECLRLWVNNTEFAYKICPDCQRKSRWAHWDEVEAAEALNPEPEHTRYEESIASANYSQIEPATEAPAPVEEKFTCFKRGCTVEVDERDLFCDDHALELSMIRAELFGD